MEPGGVIKGLDVINSVLFANGIDVINTLSAAQTKGVLKTQPKRYLSPAILVLDELGRVRGVSLLFCYKDDTDKQEDNSDETRRAECEFFDPEPSKRIDQIRTYYLAGYSGTNRCHYTQSRNGEDISQHITDSENPSEESPERCSLHSFQTCSGAAECSCRHQTDQDDAARQKRDG
jgi:hypothetical protein